MVKMQNGRRLDGSFTNSHLMDAYKALTFADCCGLSDVMRVESIQEKVQSALEEYCRTQRQQQVVLLDQLQFISSFYPFVFVLTFSIVERAEPSH